MTRVLLVSIALMVAFCANGFAQVIRQDYDPFTGQTTIAYANPDGSVTVEVIDAFGNVVFRSIRPAWGYTSGSYRYGRFYPYYSRIPSPRATPTTRPAPDFGIPIPDTGRTVRNPNTGGTLQTHPNPDGTRTVVEVDGRGNVRTYVVPGGR